MPVHNYLTLGKVLLPPPSNGTCLFTRCIPRENVRNIHRHDLHHCLSGWHPCTYLWFIWWSPTTTWKHFQMTPSQQPSSQCQKIKLLCTGDQILRLHNYQRRYQTTTTKGQHNPSSCPASQCKASLILRGHAEPLQGNDSLPLPSSNTTYSTYQEECQIWMDTTTSTSLQLTQTFPCSQSCPCLPRLLCSLWNLHRCLKIPNWIHHYTKGQATCILFKKTHWSSNEIHCDRTQTACDSGNTLWVQVYSPWTFDSDLHQSQESYLFKLHYQLRHLLVIDCWGIRSQHCLPSWQTQYNCWCSLLPTKTQRTAWWINISWWNLCIRCTTRCISNRVRHYFQSTTCQ